MTFTVMRQDDGCTPEAVLVTADLDAAKTWIFRHGGNPADTFPENDAVGGVGYNLVSTIEDDGFVFPIAWIEA